MINLPVDFESVVEEFVIEKSVRGENGPDGDQQVH